MSGENPSPETLNVGERRLLTFARQTRSLMMLTDVKGRIVWVNEAFTRTTGYGPDEAVGRTPGELLQGPGTDARTVRQMAEALAKGRGFEAEVVNYNKDGRAYWIDLEVQPVFGADGAVVEFVAIGHDITARKVAEAAEHQRERDARRVAMVAALTPNAVVITDAGGYIEWVNDAFTRLSGFEPEEAIGRRPGALLQGPETDPRTVERMRRALLARESFREEVVNYTKDGRPYWLAIHMRPIAEPDAGGYVAVETDITAQKLAQAALARSEAEHQEIAMIVDLLDTAFAIEELDGTLRWVNEAWIRLYGYDCDEAIGRRAQDLFDGPVTDPDLRRKVDEACARGDPMRFQITNYRKDGMPIGVLVERRPVRDSRGLINRVVSICIPDGPPRPNIARPAAATA